MGKVLKDSLLLERIIDLRYGIVHDYNGQYLYNDFIAAFNWRETPQGHGYWQKRYYWVAQQQDKWSLECTPLSEEDWGYLVSLLPKKIDPFLVDPENKEFIVE